MRVPKEIRKKGESGFFVRNFQTQLLLQRLVPVPNRNLSNSGSFSNVFLCNLFVLLQTSNIECSCSQTHRVFTCRKPFPLSLRQHCYSCSLSFTRYTVLLRNF